MIPLDAFTRFTIDLLDLAVDRGNRIRLPYAGDQSLVWIDAQPWRSDLVGVWLRSGLVGFDLILNIAQPALPPGVAAGFPANRPVEPTPAGTGNPAGEVRPDSSGVLLGAQLRGESGQPPSEPTCA